MTAQLPHNLLTLFTPRPALRYIPPADCPPEERRTQKIDGLAQYIGELKAEDGGDTSMKEAGTQSETPFERKIRLQDERLEKRAKYLKEGINNYDPKDDPNFSQYDPFKTLFVYRLSYRATINDLERAFAGFGRISRIRVPVGRGMDDPAANHKGRPRGYAFVVFEHESDMREALRRAQGMPIHNRPIAVDVVRAQTVQGWKPRRLGGGAGPGRVTDKPAGRPDFGRAPMGPGGGFRGGFRGGRGGGGFRGGYRGRDDFRGDRGGYRGDRGPPSGPRDDYRPRGGGYRDRGGGFERPPPRRYDDRRPDERRW